jgi:hypothetical protein
MVGGTSIVTLCESGALRVFSKYKVNICISFFFFFLSKFTKKKKNNKKEKMKSGKSKKEEYACVDCGENMLVANWVAHRAACADTHQLLTPGALRCESCEAHRVVFPLCTTCWRAFINRCSCARRSQS